MVLVPDLTFLLDSSGQYVLNLFIPVRTKRLRICWLVFFVLLIAAGGIFGQPDEAAEARLVVERYEAALAAGNITELDEIREKAAAAIDVDFVRQRTPGSIRVRSSTITRCGFQDGFFFCDVHRELEDRDGSPAKLFGQNDIRVFARRRDGVMRVAGRLSSAYWLGNEILNAKGPAERLEIIKSNPGTDHREAIIRSVFRFRITGDLDNSARAITTCRTVANETSDIAFLARCELNQALLYIVQERYRPALKTLLISEKLSLQVGDRHGYARALSAMGDLYGSQGNPAMNQSLQQRALAEIENAGISELESRITLSGINLGLANALIAMGSLDEAYKYLVLGSDLGIRIDGAADFPARLQMARVERLRGNVQKALDILSDLEQYARSRPPMDIETLVQSLNEIAAIRLYNLHDANSAEKSAREAVKLASDAQLALYETQSLTILGNSLSALGSVDEAEKAFRQAVNLIENRRTMVAGGSIAATKYFDDRLEPYDRLVEILVKSGRDLEAMQFAERSKARTLAEIVARRDQLREDASGENVDGVPKHRRQLADLNLSLVLEKQKVVPDKVKIAEFERAIEAARLRVEDQEMRAASLDPKAGILSGVFEPVDERRLDNLLPDRTASVEYLVTDAVTYVFVIARDHGRINIKAHSINIGKTDLTKKISAFRVRLESADLNYKHDAAELYRLLLSKVEPELKKADSMLIVPDAVIWDVPFQALLTPDNRFLIEKILLRYAPSLTAVSVIKAANPKGSSETTNILAFGNPRISKDNAIEAEKLRGESLEALPSAEKEVDALARLFKPANRTILKGPEATEAYFSKHGKSFDIIHFATHGILNGRNPLYSALFLSVSPNSADDGLLEAWELTDMKLNSKLVVMSACETARGHSAGEGLVGLTWAFMVAGVPRVVASQWKVESKSTATLMKAFYTNLRTNGDHSVPKALRSSMLQMIKSGDRRHPFFWAGFIPIGG